MLVSIVSAKRVKEGPALSDEDAFDEDLGFKVAHKRCDQCLYSGNKIVGDVRKRDVLDNCKKTGKYFLCHKSTIGGKAVVCRGFYDVEDNQSCRVATTLKIVVFVDPSTGKPV